jgi:hypothetical protein
MRGVKNYNISRAAFELMGGTWKSLHRAGGACSLELEAVFKKPRCPALCSLLSATATGIWHMASYDPSRPHCIDIFVVNALAKSLALELPGIPIPAGAAARFSSF